MQDFFTPSKERKETYKRIENDIVKLFQNNGITYREAYIILGDVKSRLENTSLKIKV